MMHDVYIVSKYLTLFPFVSLIYISICIKTYICMHAYRSVVSLSYNIIGVDPL